MKTDVSASGTQAAFVEDVCQKCVVENINLLDMLLPRAKHTINHQRRAPTATAATATATGTAATTATSQRFGTDLTLRG
eukprot:5853182-Amphidinium_carterae.1